MLSIFSFLVSFLFFFLAVIVCLYLPGFWILKKSRLKLDELEEVSLSLSLGIVFFVILSLVLGYLGLRLFLVWLVILLSLNTFRLFGWEPILALNPRRWKLRNKKIFFIVLILGVLTQIWINVFSGWHYSDGIRFWSAHGHDGVWHGSVMEELRERFPPQMRFIAGFKIQNYHYFVDVLMGEFYRLFRFDPLDLYFRHFTFLFAFLFLLNSFVLVRNWRSEKAGLWALVFAVFGGSFGYWMTLFQNKTLLGSEARFWVSQTNTAIGNPPQIAAFILFLAFLNLFYRWWQRESKPLFFTLAVLGGMLVGFKVYAGAMILGGLLLTGFYQYFFQKETRVLKLFLAVLLPALLVFFSSTSKGANFLIFQPWWFVRTMVVAGDRLDWVDLELRRQFYIAQHNWRGYLRVLQFEFLALTIFIVGNLGTKILGVGEIFRILCSRFKPAIFDLFLIFCLLVCFVFPHLFVQRGVAWNTVQFFQYFILLMGIFAAVSMVRMLKGKRKSRKILMVVFLVLFSIPTVVGNLILFAPNNSLAIVENKELEALRALKENTNEKDVIVTHPFDPWAAMAYPQQPRPIHAWSDTGYVSYFADRSTFISDEEQVEIMGYSQGKERTSALKRFLFGKGEPGEKIGADKAKSFLIENNLKYVYLVYGQKLAFDPQEIGLKKIFENEAARIYKLIDQLKQ